MEKEKIRVLIGDDSAEHGVRLAAALRELGLYAFTRVGSSASIFTSIANDCPDVVVTDLTLSDTDALSLISKTRRMIRECPVFIVTSEISNSFVERQVIECGADHYLVSPFDPERLCRVIKSLVAAPAGISSGDLELQATDLIRRLGVPAHIKGYHYLRSAIIASVEDRGLMDCVTKQLYPYIARQYNTTSTRVERSIRHAIELAWDRGSTEVLCAFSGCVSGTLRGRPTNSEFIALAADKLRLLQKSAGVRRYTDLARYTGYADMVI